MSSLTQPIGAPVAYVGTYDVTDYADEHEAESHARSWSLVNPGRTVRCNVHPMASSPYVAFTDGCEVWRATPAEVAAMAREGVRLLRAESGR